MKNLALELTKQNSSYGATSYKLCNLSKLHFPTKLPSEIVELIPLLVLSEVIWYNVAVCKSQSHSVQVSQVEGCSRGHSLQPGFFTYKCPEDLWKEATGGGVAATM